MDSSVAAALLAAERRDGGAGGDGRLDASLADEGEGDELRRSCCSPDAADDARRVAQLAGIPFFVLDLEREFGSEVVDAFVDGYLDGATPNPCQACNQHIKFDVLLQRGLAAYGADRSPPGTTHGSRPMPAAGATCCARATSAKDQTYFLWTLDPGAAARHTRFPLGELTKPEVRAIAHELALPTAAKPESQEICFVPLGDYRALLAERRGYDGEPGSHRRRRRDRGRHAHRLRALHRGPAARARARAGRGRLRREVVPATNTVVIGRRDEIASRSFVAAGRHFIGRRASRGPVHGRRFASATGPSRSPAR